MISTTTRAPQTTPSAPATVPATRFIATSDREVHSLVRTSWRGVPKTRTTSIAGVAAKRKTSPTAITPTRVRASGPVRAEQRLAPRHRHEPDDDAVGEHRDPERPSDADRDASGRRRLLLRLRQASEHQRAHTGDEVEQREHGDPSESQRAELPERQDQTQGQLRHQQDARVDRIVGEEPQGAGTVFRPPPREPRQGWPSPARQEAGHPAHEGTRSPGDHERRRRGAVGGEQRHGEGDLHGHPARIEPHRVHDARAPVGDRAKDVLHAPERHRHRDHEEELPEVALRDEAGDEQPDGQQESEPTSQADAEVGLARHVSTDTPAPEQGDVTDQHAHGPEEQPLQDQHRARGPEQGRRRHPGDQDDGEELGAAREDLIDEGGADLPGAAEHDGAHEVGRSRFESH